MKIALIVLAFVGGLVFCGWKITSHFSQKGEKAKVHAQALKEETKAAQTAELPGQASEMATRQLDAKAQTLGVAPIDEVTIGNYQFVNRVAPEPPSFLRSENTRLLVERDPVNNAWAWMGSKILTFKILELAKMYDRTQAEMDLEFVLVLLSTSKLRDRGVSLFFDDRALWMNALTLDGDSGSLRITSSGVSMDLSLQNSNGAVSVLSQPVIRVMDSDPWEFATDTEVPVPASDVVDGVVRQTVDYRTIGFGLKGTVRCVGKSVIMQIEQRNGSVVTKPAGTSSLPEFSNQRISTSLQLAWWEWSVLGGIQVDKEEMTRGIFRDKVQSSSDYLVIFVRPRLALSPPLRAVPVLSDDDVHPLLDEGFGVLPAPDWRKHEEDFLRSRK